jgi:signal peptidase I
MKLTRSVIWAALLLGAVLALVFTFPAAIVDGDSMMPTLRNGQIVFAARWFARPHKGDIVLVRRGRDVLVKRIVYLPHETLEPLDRPLFRECADFFEPGPTPDLLRVPSGRVVVMGDNRAHSDDSRRFGPVRMSDIIGRVIAVSPLP